jgi:hypothetical protein
MGVIAYRDKKVVGVFDAFFMLQFIILRADTSLIISKVASYLFFV